MDQVNNISSVHTWHSKNILSDCTLIDGSPGFNNDSKELRHVVRDSAVLDQALKLSLHYCVNTLLS